MQRLRILFVEDVEQDALLLARELQRGGFDITFRRVDTAEAMAAALEEAAWDAVISDYFMPRFNALDALALVKARQLDLPFIIVSGTVSEDTAVEAIRAGAHDFMPKGKYARLIPALERELRDAKLRSERSKMQEQLLISDRMASVGTLAAGIAHEINNPLAALIAYIHFASQDAVKLASEERTQEPKADRVADREKRLRDLGESLEGASEAAERLRRIVQDVKLFSRSDEETVEGVNIDRVLDSSLRMAWNLVRHRAKVVKDYGAVPLVKGNESRLGQVFLNLIVNAAQSIPEGSADQNEIGISTGLNAQGQVEVKVRDSGAGIPAAVLSRVFDPFFTTKPWGEGTGLGLAICHKIVRSLGGAISVESKVGKGACFTITLPKAEIQALESTPATIPAREGRGGRILVIDDEPAMLVVIERMLAPSHEVVTSSSGRAALKRLAAGETFDVILCDLMMPQLSGMDFQAELMRLEPRQAERIVFMTGGAFTPRAQAFLAQVRGPRLEKPFKGSTLLAMLDDLLRPDAQPIE